MVSHHHVNLADHNSTNPVSFGNAIYTCVQKVTRVEWVQFLSVWQCTWDKNLKNKIAIRIFIKWSLHYIQNNHSCYHAKRVLYRWYPAKRSIPRHADAWQIGPFWQDTLDMWWKPMVVLDERLWQNNSSFDMEAVGVKIFPFRQIFKNQQWENILQELTMGKVIRFSYEIAITTTRELWIRISRML